MKRLITVAVLAIALGGTLSSAQDSERLFKAAMNSELVDGNLKSAIDQYRRVAEGRDRALAARALVRMAECFQKLGDSEAQNIYQRLARDFQDQPEPAALARARLRLPPSDRHQSVTLRSLPRSGGLPGTVSLDGRFLTFVNWDDGKLYVRDLQTGNDRALTQANDFNIGSSAISTNAALAAYQSYAGGCDGKGTRAALCLVAITGTAPTVPRSIVESDDILEIAPMTWSPDSGTIAVNLRRRDRTAQIGLVTAADGSLRVLQTVDWRGPTRIFYSPDGRDLLFDLPVSDNSDERSIQMVAVDGSRAITAVDHPSQNIVMGWTPDGSELLFASDRGGAMGLWAQPFESRRPRGAPRLIRSDIGGAWSMGVTRDGSLYFGVRKHDRDISLMTMDLAQGKLLTPPARFIRRFVGTNALPTWSASGEHVAYISQRGFDPTNNSLRIIGIRNMTTGEERELRPKLTYFGAMSWSPNTDTLLTAGTDVKGRSGVFTIDTRTGDASLLVAATVGAYPQWSPDGKRFFYRQVEEGRQEISTLLERETASGSERMIASGNFAVFSVSPDGRFIATALGNVSQALSHRLVQIRVDNGEIRDLLHAGPSERLPPYVAPQWTADGRAILMRKRTPNELWLVPVDGASPRKIIDLDVHDWSFGPIGQFSVHPDGRQVAFLSGSISNEMRVLENFLPSPSARR